MLFTFQGDTQKFQLELGFGPGFNSTSPLKMTCISQIHKQLVSRKKFKLLSLYKQKNDLVNEVRFEIPQSSNGRKYYYQKYDVKGKDQNNY